MVTNQPFHEASVLTVPPDDCPHCRAEHIQAHRTYTYVYTSTNTNEIRGWYRCGDCRHTWHTTWRIEPIT